MHLIAYKAVDLLHKAHLRPVERLCNGPPFLECALLQKLRRNQAYELEEAWNYPEWRCFCGGVAVAAIGGISGRRCAVPPGLIAAPGP